MYPMVLMVLVPMVLLLIIPHHDIARSSPRWTFEPPLAATRPAALGAPRRCSRGFVAGDVTMQLHQERCVLFGVRNSNPQRSSNHQNRLQGLVWRICCVFSGYIISPSTCMHWLGDIGCVVLRSRDLLSKPKLHQ